MQSASQAAEAHYAREDLAERILDGLRAAGLDIDRLTPDDLAPADEFHIRGREATEELGELAEPRAGQRALEVGCGLGGTARYLAARHGLEVVGVDLTAEYWRVGNMLTERTGLADRVELVTADAMELPFEDSSFDQVWTEHVTMSIADKRALNGELRRVLREAGRLAFYEIVAGQAGEVHFPVPWARRPFPPPSRLGCEGGVRQPGAQLGGGPDQAGSGRCRGELRGEPELAAAPASRTAIARRAVATANRDESRFRALGDPSSPAAANHARQPGLSPSHGATVTTVRRRRTDAPPSSRAGV